uniref:Uncharacterized protein n=1 Tax=Neobodo designis TaxID=312471 RepID=A0A7S1R4A5_NEODS|mmetsp:Transcript_789/g.2726  ORF Transcript_789/g.2726 Transcript_789/m.2726 type:complete len:116 (+) Transcript_789:208-555(+)
MGCSASVDAVPGRKDRCVRRLDGVSTASHHPLCLDPANLEPIEVEFLPLPPAEDPAPPAVIATQLGDASTATWSSDIVHAPIDPEDSATLVILGDLEPPQENTRRSPNRGWMLRR